MVTAHPILGRVGSGFGGIGNTTVADNFARHCRLVADNPYVILPSSKG